MLLAADMENKRVYFYNSMWKTESGRVYFCHFRNFLRTRAQHHGLQFNPAEWTFVLSSQETPQQENDYDCGVFVLMGIYFLSAGSEWNNRPIGAGLLLQFRLSLTRWLLTKRLD